MPGARDALVLKVSAPQFARVRDELRVCAAQGVAAATLPALLKQLPAAARLFWEEFELCSRHTEWREAELFVEKSCRQPGGQTSMRPRSPAKRWKPSCARTSRARKSTTRSNGSKPKAWPIEGRRLEFALMS